MRCPKCGCDESKVVDSRPSENNDAIRRRRECTSCGFRFTTYERREEMPILVIKKDGHKETFDRQKLMFYRGKRVYVVGGGNSACEEALFLTRFASEVVLVVRKDHLRAQASVARQLEENPKVTMAFTTTLVAVGGGELLSWISLRDETTGQVRTDRYDEGSFGVFVFVGRVPATSLVSGMLVTP